MGAMKRVQGLLQKVVFQLSWLENKSYNELLFYSHFEDTDQDVFLAKSLPLVNIAGVHLQIILWSQYSGFLISPSLSKPEEYIPLRVFQTFIKTKIS